MGHSHHHGHDGHHDHGHDHAHGHGHGHDHGVTASNERQALLAAGLTVSFMLAEVAGGLWSGSLALLADAGHMLTDTAALLFAWLGFHLSRRPATPGFTYGLKRFPVLVAYTSGLSMFLLTAWIVIEAIGRLRAPVPVVGGAVMVIATIGLLVNIGAFWILSRADRGNLNIRGAILHVLGDLLGSVAAIVAGAVIYFTGWTLIDPLLSLVVAVLLGIGAWRLTRDAGRLLLEATPLDHDVDLITRDIADTVPGVVDIHHVHVWSLVDDQAIITLHARVDDEAENDRVVAAVKERLARRFGIGHATVEIEKGACADTVLAAHG